MLVKEKIENCPDLTSSEKVVADFILGLGLEVNDLSTSEIAKNTFTSPATAVRLAKKIGFSGWNELKDSLFSETKYLDSHFSEVDANIPFNENDSFMTIANKVGALEIETIHDTIALLDYKVLHEAAHLLNKAQMIYIFGTSVSLMLAEQFKYKMIRIGRKVTVSLIHSEQTYETEQVSTDDCAIILSYSGEDKFLKEIVNHLKEKEVNMISVTNIGSNTIAKTSNVNLFCSTREKLNYKIGAYSSVGSMDFIMDVFYSCIFSIDYKKNLKKRLELAKKYEIHRTSDTKQLIDETNNISKQE